MWNETRCHICFIFHNIIFIRECPLNFNLFHLFVVLTCFMNTSFDNRPSIDERGQFKWCLGLGNIYVHINIGSNVGTVFTRSNNTKNVSHINVIKTLHDFTATWLWFCVFSYIRQKMNFLRHMVDLIWCFTGFAREKTCINNYAKKEVIIVKL